MAHASISDQDLISFLNWCLPRLHLRWQGFRKVRGTVRKRLLRRLRELDLPDLAAYRRRLEADSKEWHVLDRFCHIPISRFYRDRLIFEAFATEILPDCANRAKAAGRGTVRVLSAGCASGEEPYTISVIWHVRHAAHYAGIELEIRAVDVDDSMLRRAAAACYSTGSFKDMPCDLFQAGFEPRNGANCLREKFRSGVFFEKLDLRESIPGGPFDAILCRNTAFTYFGESTQDRVFSGLDFGLREGGYLVIGAHEKLPCETASYQPLRAGLPIYRKSTNV